MKILKWLILCWVITAPVFADVVDDARQLLEQKKPKQAFTLLKKAINDENLQQARFKLALADAARLYAPHIPVLNGGDRSQVQAYQGAGEFYLEITNSKEADETEKVLAEVGLTRLKQTMFEEANRCLKDGSLGQSIRLAEALSHLWPKDITGPSLIYQVGIEAKEKDVQLRGLRGMVAAKVKRVTIYELAAMLEQEEGVGNGIDAALKHLDAGLSLFPVELSLLDTKTRLLVELGRKEQALGALADLDKAAEQTSDEKKRAQAMAAAGSHYDKLGRPKEALERYQRAVKGLPNYLPLRVALGSLHFQFASEAMKKLDDSQEPDFSNREILTHLELAKTELEFAHEHGEPNTTIMLTLSEIYQRLGDIEAATAMRRDIKKVRAGQPIR